MTKRKLFWLCSAVLTFTVFYEFIPYNSFPLILSIIGGALLTFFSVQALKDYKSWEDFNYGSGEAEDWKDKLMPFMVAPGIIMMIVFYVHFGSKEREALQTNGERVTGIVTDGVALKGRRAGHFNLTVQFTTKEGERYVVTESVTDGEYNRVSKGDEVELVYLKGDPTVIDLLITPGSMKMYDFAGKTEQRIDVKALLGLMDLQNDSLGATLNSMSYKWTFHENDSTWRNNMKELYIKSNNENYIMLIVFNFSDVQKVNQIADVRNAYKDQFTALNFSQQQAEGMTLFTNEHYGAMVEDITLDTGMGYKLGQKIQIYKK